MGWEWSNWVRSVLISDSWLGLLIVLAGFVVFFVVIPLIFALVSAWRATLGAAAVTAALYVLGAPRWVTVPAFVVLWLYLLVATGDSERRKYLQKLMDMSDAELNTERARWARKHPDWMLDRFLTEYPEHTFEEVWSVYHPRTITPEYARYAIFCKYFHFHR
jgi:hypothetical protein